MLVVVSLLFHLHTFTQLEAFPMGKPTCHQNPNWLSGLTGAPHLHQISPTVCHPTATLLNVEDGEPSGIEATCHIVHKLSLGNSEALPIPCPAEICNEAHASFTCFLARLDNTKLMFLQEWKSVYGSCLVASKPCQHLSKANSYATK